VVSITIAIENASTYAILPSGSLMRSSWVIVPISLVNLSEATGFGLSINYDPSSVLIHDVMLNRSLLPDAELTAEYHDGKLIVAVTSSSLLNLSSTSPALLLNVSGIGVAGEVTHLHSTHAEWSDPLFQPHLMPVTSGSFSLLLRGDFNENGAVDIGDVAKTAYMAASLTHVDQRADFNDDGIVNGADASMISYAYVGKTPPL
jgi:hypothetical protein